MARALSVTVKADIGQYARAMKRAGAETDNFSRKMSHVGRAGMAMSRLGDTLTRRVSLPIIAVGAVAAKMALDFDKSFTQMQTLAGVTAGEVDGMRESVLKLSGETGRAPKELADALYFIVSSGLEGSDALDALEMSAKAAAIGLGSTMTIADLVTSAMNAYGPEVLSAAQATDVLTKAVAVGKAEASEIAGSLGQLLPLASTLGVRFDDVAAAIASMTLTGSSADEAATQLNAIMSTLTRTTPQVEKAFQDAGTSGAELRATLGEEDGLLKVLKQLWEASGQNIEAFSRFFPNVRALRGALDLLSQDGETATGIFEKMNDSAGTLNKSFEIWGQSLSGKTSKAIADFQVALIQVGEIIVPIAADILSLAAGFAKAFSGLPSEVKTAAVVFGLLLAAIGPVLSIGGRIVQVYATVGKTIGFAATNIKSLGIAAGVVGGMVLLAEALSRVSDEARSINVTKLENELLDLAETSVFAGENLDKVFDQGPIAAGGAERAKDLADLSGELGKLDEALAQLEARDPEAAAAAFDLINEKLREMGLTKSEIEAVFDTYDTALAETDTASRTAAGGIEETEAAMADLGAETEEAVSALQEYSDALKAMTDPLFGAMNALTGNRDAQVAYQDSLTGVMKAQEALDEAISEHGAKSDEAAEATRNLEKAERDVADAQWATVKSAAEADSALAGLKDAVDSGDVSIDTFKETLKGWVRQGFLTQEQADEAAASVSDLADEADRADKKRVDIPVKETGGSRVLGQLSAVQQAAINAGRQKPNVHVRATDRASGVIGGIRQQLGALPSSKTITVTALYRQSGLARSTLGRALARQHGGPVEAGRAYVVGEKRPELFVPDRDGTILPSVPATNFGSSASAGGGGYVDNRSFTINLYGGDPEGTVTALKRYMRSNGPVPIRVRG